MKNRRDLPGEILKRVKKGMMLYSPCYGELEFVRVDDMGRDFKATPSIICKRKGSNSEKTFFMDGSISTHGECMLFPSKDNRDWSALKQDVMPDFKPKEWVLVKADVEGSKWTLGIFSHYNADSDRSPYVTTAGVWPHCIPYEGNEYLLGLNSMPLLNQKGT